VGASPHHDALGSVRALTDETGTTVDTRAYEAFGTKNVEAGNDPLRYGFAGEPFEPRASSRTTEPGGWTRGWGRFEGMDPSLGDSEDPSSLHAYVYGANNPVTDTDPSGRIIVPSNPLWGIIVHQQIGQDFVKI
jgi:RHS repeat-associated protein